MTRADRKQARRRLAMELCEPLQEAAARLLELHAGEIVRMKNETIREKERRIQELERALKDAKPATEQAQEVGMTDAERAANLVLLIEECGEVIQAATKALRFGWLHSWPDYEGGLTNNRVVAKEVGQLMACIERLHLSPSDVWAGRVGKHEKLKRFGPEGDIGEPMMAGRAALATDTGPLEGE
jgi:hypothetical protein